MSVDTSNSVQQAGILRRTAKTVARAYAETLGDMLPNLSNETVVEMVTVSVIDTLALWADEFNIPWSRIDIQGVIPFAKQEVETYITPF